MKFDTATLISQTSWSREHYSAILERAATFLLDPQKEKRIQAQLCIPCFYVERIGGATMTFQDCADCGVEQCFGSTDTDMLCLTCARKNVLCRHCGGDINMKVRRKSWPTDK